MTTLSNPLAEPHQRLSQSSPCGPGTTLSSLFRTTCETHPDRTAITFGTESITYGELNRAAGRVASALRTRGVSANTLVAIYLDRSLEMVIAMLGVIQAGAAYLPLDPNYPTARVLETLADASPTAILADEAHALSLPTDSNTILMSNILARLVDTASAIGEEPQPDDLAYVIYTSGSTGRPKGVMVSHRNVVRLLTQTEDWFHFNEQDVWTMFHSFAFDFSVWEIWGCLLTGGRLVIVPYTLSRSPDDFYAMLADERVTVLNQTPTAFNLLMDAEARTTARPLALRTVIFGGEALNLRSLLPWFAQHGDQRPALINMYGITETTVHVTYRRILAQDAARETESLIGQPIPDLTLHLLDAELQPVAPGEVGEICVGGPGVALGYLNRPDLTAQRFVADPLSLSGGRFYRSGDLARTRADGELVYLGRADRQVKVNGFRIELGEIEAVLTECTGVSQVCVITHADPAAGLRLAAYFVSATTTPGSLGEFAAERLPAHMRPAFYTPITALPLNANGKVDRDALPAPQRPVTKLSAPYSTGSPNSLEARVAAIWQRVLKLDTIAPTDNFFDVGGSSLLLIALRNELQSALDTTIPITWLFEHTTIRSLATKLAASSQQTVTPVTQPKAQPQRNAFAAMKALRAGQQSPQTGASR